MHPKPYQDLHERSGGEGVASTGAKPIWCNAGAGYTSCFTPQMRKAIPRGERLKMEEGGDWKIKHPGGV